VAAIRYGECNAGGHGERAGRSEGGSGCVGLEGDPAAQSRCQDSWSSRARAAIHQPQPGIITAPWAVTVMLPGSAPPATGAHNPDGGPS
jgi:hypothetical protein